MPDSCGVTVVLSTVGAVAAVLLRIGAATGLIVFGRSGAVAAVLLGIGAATGWIAFGRSGAWATAIG